MRDEKIGNELSKHVPVNYSLSGLHVEAEVHDVAVLNYVVFAFDVHLAGFLYGGLAAQCHVVVVFYHLGADKTFLEVAVYHSRALRSLAAAAEGPCSHFLRAGGEEGFKVEQLVGCLDEAVHARFLKPYFAEEHLFVLV